MGDMTYASRAVDVLAPAQQNIPWMTWNLFLAAIPVYMAARLFRRDDSVHARSIKWWLGAGVFLFFLPNALYVLTDLVHVAQDVPASSNHWQVAFIIVPQYLIFCAIGFMSYVVSLIWLGRMLSLHTRSRFVVTFVELSMHLVCSVGVYLGRFVRFNSWDIVARPYSVAQTIGETVGSRVPIVVIGIFFVSTTVLYGIAKHVTIAVVTYIRTGGPGRARTLTQKYL